MKFKAGIFDYSGLGTGTYWNKAEEGIHCNPDEAYKLASEDGVEFIRIDRMKEGTGYTLDWEKYLLKKKMNKWEMRKKYLDMKPISKKGKRKYFTFTEHTDYWGTQISVHVKGYWTDTVKIRAERGADVRISYGSGGCNGDDTIKETENFIKALQWAIKQAKRLEIEICQDKKVA